MTKKALLTLIFISTIITQTHAKSDPNVAVVNGIAIKKSYFDQYYNQTLMFVSDKKVTREKVLDDLINRELGILRAKRNRLQNDLTVKRKMEDILYHAQISKDLEGEFQKINVSDSDVKRYYEENKEYRTSHILFRVRAVPSQEEVIAAQEQAMKIYELLQQNPNKFGEVASKYSQSNTSESGGDMGFQPARNFPPEYYAAIKNKKKGYISPPVRTQYGYHLIKVLGIRPFKDISIPLYKKFVYDKKRDKILENYFSKLRKNAKISVNKTYLY